MQHLSSVLTTTFVFLVLTVRVSAQTEASDFARIGFGAFLTPVVSDYQCMGINPANLGFRPSTDIYVMASPMGGGVERSRRALSFTVAEGGLSAHSDALPRSGLIDALFNNSSITFSEADKRRAAADFAGRGVRFSADVIAFGIAFQTEDIGGFALTVRERAMGTFRFNESAARLAFEGRYYDYFDSTAVNFAGDTVGYSTEPVVFSDLFAGTRLAMMWFREIGAGYGITIATTDDYDFSVGAAVKYLMGYAYLDAQADPGNLRAASALSPVFGISYGKATSPSFIPGTNFESVGGGWGLDIGATLRIRKWTISASVVDLGAIRWNGNVFEAKDTILNGMSSTGFDSYNIFEEAPKITGEGNYFRWSGLATATSELPSRVRGGIAYRYDNQWRFGLDVIAPLNQTSGALGEPLWSAGADFRPVAWLRLGTGIGGGGNMGTFIPLSSHFSLFDGMWEFGIASRDLLTLFTSRRPVVSLTVGVTRFRL